MRRNLLLTAVVAAAAVAAVPPAQAGPPKPFSGSATVTDLTPDPTGGLGANCQGTLPVEKGMPLKVPGPGVLTVALSGFTGDWALVVTDDTGKVLGSSDTFPDTENAVVTLKKATSTVLLACNLGGTVEAKLTWAYRYKKP